MLKIGPLVAQHTWTSFEHNLGPAFNTRFSLFLFFAETTMFIVFSAKHAQVKDTPKRQQIRYL